MRRIHAYALLHQRYVPPTRPKDWNYLRGTPFNSPLLLPIGAVLLAMFSIQGGASLAKRLFPVVGAQGTTALRLGLAALLLIAVLRPWRAKITLSNWLPVTVYGVVLGCMNLMFYMALNTIPLGIAVALEFTGPLAIALVSSRRVIDFAWIVLATLGLLLLLPIGRSAHTLDPTGILFALGAGGGWALYIIFGRRAGADHGNKATVLGTMVAAVVALPIGIAHAGAEPLLRAVVPVGIAVAILSSALPYTLEMFALRRLAPQMFGTMMSLEPAIGALAGFTFLSETLSPFQWLAIGMIVSASIGTTLTIKSDAT